MNLIEPSINGYFEGFCYTIKTCSIIYLSKYEKYTIKSVDDAYKERGILLFFGVNIKLGP